MSVRISMSATALVLSLSAFLLLPTRALAHEARDVGKYHMVVGFIVEPPYEGEKNGLDLHVSTVATPSTPVTNLEKTLQVEIGFVGNGKTVVKPIRAVSASSDPGHYTADILPTQPGQYSFRIFGAVEGQQVNETFTSGAKFDNVHPASELTFPDPPAQLRAVQSVATGAQQSADQAGSTASTARLIAIAGLVVALLGLGLAARATMRR